MLDGYKTYICAALLIGAAVCKKQGWIDETAWQIILTVLNGLGLAALRAGVKKRECE